MTLKIIWSDFAESQLDEIYEYYVNKAGSAIAKKLIKGIINAPNKLLKSPYIGQEEQFLTHRKIDYRYLVHKNYKLIYWHNISKNRIEITDVFDTR